MCRVVRGWLCGVYPFIFTWNPGLNSGHQVCDRCFTCWVILIDSPVFYCLINIILFHLPPTSLPLCVHACFCICVCMHVWLMWGTIPSLLLFYSLRWGLSQIQTLTLQPANFWRFHLCFPRPPHPPGIYIILGIQNLAFLHAYRASTFPQLHFLWLRCRNLHFPEY